MVLVVPERSDFVGTVFDEIKVPAPFWNAGQRGSEFLSTDEP
jgi:hypothetical protein